MIKHFCDRCSAVGDEKFPLKEIHLNFRWPRGAIPKDSGAIELCNVCYAALREWLLLPPEPPEPEDQAQKMLNEMRKDRWDKAEKKDAQPR